MGTRHTSFNTFYSVRPLSKINRNRWTLDATLRVANLRLRFISSQTDIVEVRNEENLAEEIQLWAADNINIKFIVLGMGCNHAIRWEQYGFRVKRRLWCLYRWRLRAECFWWEFAKSLELLMKCSRLWCKNLSNYSVKLKHRNWFNSVEPALMFHDFERFFVRRTNATVILLTRNSNVLFVFSIYKMVFKLLWVLNKSYYLESYCKFRIHNWHRGL